MSRRVSGEFLPHIFTKKSCPGLVAAASGEARTRLPGSRYLARLFGTVTVTVWWERLPLASAAVRVIT